MLGDCVGALVCLTVYPYLQDPGLVVEPMTTSSSSQSARSSAAQPSSSSSSSTTSNNQPRQRYSGMNFIEFPISQKCRPCGEILYFRYKSLVHLNAIYIFSCVGQASRTSGTSTTPTSSPTSPRWDRQTIQFSVNAWVLYIHISGGRRGDFLYNLNTIML